MKTIIKPVVLNGRPAWLKRNKQGKYFATVSGIPKECSSFNEGVSHIEKQTGVKFPF